jgi:hypothetical protein
MFCPTGTGGYDGFIWPHQDGLVGPNETVIAKRDWAISDSRLGQVPGHRATYNARSARYLVHARIRVIRGMKRPRCR